MTEIPFLRDLGIIVVSAMVFVLLGRKLGAPTIISYIVAGLVLGPILGLCRRPTRSI